MLDNDYHLLTVLPLTQVQVHRPQTHAAPAIAAALDAQFPTTLSALQCLSCAPL